jgi:hypothetical protein
MALGIAAICGSGRQVVVVIDMAGGARHVRVAICQQEPRSAVIKLCTKPTVERMTGFACGGKLRAGVVRIGGLLVVVQMTGCASGRKSLKLADGRALVTILALHRSMSAEERKTILVIVDLFC